MKRTLLAFLIAPLWTPVIAGIDAALSDTRPQQVVKLAHTEWVAIVVVGHLVIGCLAAWTVGVGLHLLLRKWRVTALWQHVAAWFAAGLMLRALLIFAAWFTTGGVGMGLREVAEKAVTHPLFLLAGGVVGALMGATIWLIRRPDRAERVGLSPAKSI